LAGSVGGQASGSAAVMRWCVASFADGDTHLAEPGSPGQPVAAHCDGRQFSPLAILPGAPLDPEQVCLACRADQPSPAPQTRPRRATADKVTT
jgi:hypothetical protein